MTSADQQALEFQALQAINKLAMLSYHEGDITRSIRLFLASLNVQHGQSEIHANLCALFRRQSLNEKAVFHGEMAVKQDPNSAVALNNLGLALCASGSLQKANECYEAVLRLEPDNINALINRAELFDKKGDSEQALLIYQHALDYHPKKPSLLRKYGVALYNMGQLEEAKKWMHEAVENEPGVCLNWSNLGKVNKELGLFSEAAKAYKKALMLDADDANASWNLGILELLQGNYLEGFKHYEKGWKAGQRKPLRNFKRPLWLGNELLEGKRILITVEQGYGDCILCARFVSDLVQMGAKVYLEATKPISRLLNTLSTKVQVIEAGKEPEDYDYFCPIMSLPLALGVRLESLPKLGAYLCPADYDVAKFKKLLPVGLKIGIVWSGRESPPGRSVPVQLLESLFKEKASFVVLQKEISAENHDFLKNFTNVIVFSEHFNDFYDTACVIKSMDLVITIDTAVAHLAGALDVPTLVLLKHIPDWRWAITGDRSSWFSSITLLRQSQRGNWHSVIEAAREYVATMALEQIHEINAKRSER